MKMLFLIPLLFIASCCTPEVIINDEFRMDLTSTNERVWGLLAEDDEFTFDTLTYNTYLNFLQQNELYSGKGTADRIRKADKYYFLSCNDTFILALYYRAENRIISDNAEPGRRDTVFYFYAEPVEEYLRLIAERIGD